MPFEAYRKANEKKVPQQILFERLESLANDYITSSVSDAAARATALSSYKGALKAAPWITKAKDAKLVTSEFTKFEALVDGVVSQALPKTATSSYKALNFADYANGKERKAVDDAGNTWTCTITIPAETAEEIRRLDGNIALGSIKNILEADPVRISQISKKVGDRCIKPEPYGWIFSTHASTRLIDPDKSKITKPRPTSLTFDTVHKGH